MSSPTPEALRRETITSLRVLAEHEAKLSTRGKPDPLKEYKHQLRSELFTRAADMLDAQDAPAAGAQAWQPIETLEYGRRVLLLWPGQGPDIVAGSKHHSGDDAQPYWLLDGHWRNPAYPTHWMPLPTPTLGAGGSR